MTIYISPEKLRQTLTEITRKQMEKNVFVNVTVKPYRGKKYPAGTLSVKIGS